MTEERSIHSVLGRLNFDSQLGWWSGKSAKIGCCLSINSAPSTESNVETIAQFIDWYLENKDLFKNRLAFQLFKYDLIHGEDFIENALNLDEEHYEKEYEILYSKVESALLIKDINSFDNKLYVWVSSDKYTSGHWIKALLNSNYDILEMGHG